MSGVEIGGPIAALGGGLIHLFKAKDGRGSWRSVADATARDAIIPDCQEAGMLVFQIDTLTMYRMIATGSPPTYTAVSLGGSAPSGTGWVKVISGTFAVVSSLLSSDMSDFATAVTARIAATAPTGNGFARYVSGVRNSAAQLIDLVNDINAATQLPVANQVSQLGGAVVSNTVVAGYALIGTTTGSAAAWVAPPTGTGFVRYTSSVRAAVAALIDLAADVQGSLPAASVSGLTTAINSALAAYTSFTASQISDFGTAVTARIAATAPTGTGFPHYVAGVRDSATRAVDVSSADITGVLKKSAGGPSYFGSFTTTSSQVVTVMTWTLNTESVLRLLAIVSVRAAGFNYSIFADVTADVQSDGTTATLVAPSVPNNVDTGGGVSYTPPIAAFTVSGNVVSLIAYGPPSHNFTWGIQVYESGV